MSQQCCIPNCHARRTDCTLFRVPCKKYITVGTPKREWAEALEKIILGKRRDKKILELFKHDIARICEKHFDEDDIELKGNRKQLRVGAIPRHNLEKSKTRDSFLAKRRRNIRLSDEEAIEVELEEVVLPKRERKTRRVCVAFGCNKILKRKNEIRSDSEGSDDEESEIKRKHHRSFHTFPTEPKLFKQWIINIRRKDWFPDATSVICSDHFTEEYIKRDGSSVQLADNAVPTRFKAFRKSRTAVCIPDYEPG